MVVVSAAALGLSAGCQKSGAPGLTLSATAGAGSGATSGSTLSIDGGNSVAIDRVRLVISRAELEGPAACPGPSPTLGPTGPTSPDDGGRVVSGQGVMLDEGPGHDGDTPGEDGMDGDDDRCEFEGGPFLVDLSGGNLVGGVHAVAGFAAPAGTYDDVKLRVHTITTAQAAGDTAMQAMVDAGAAVLVDGSVAGTPFTFSAPLEATQKRAGPIVVDPSTGVNVTLEVDPSGWFKAADGSLLDPGAPAARDAILENMLASLRLIKDDDHDGQDDDQAGDSHH